eukprot:365011-Chlamydomonas_euryale.AAC.14
MKPLAWPAPPVLPRPRPPHLAFPTCTPPPMPATLIGSTCTRQCTTSVQRPAPVPIHCPAGGSEQRPAPVPIHCPAGGSEQ